MNKIAQIDMFLNERYMVSFSGKQGDTKLNIHIHIHYIGLLLNLI